MNKIEIVFIRKQKLPRISQKKFIAGIGWIKVNILDKNNIILNPLSIVSFTKGCTILLKINEVYCYSESFDELYKLLSIKDRETLLDYIEVQYIVNEVLNKNLIVLRITIPNKYYLISDISVIAIKDED